MKKKVILVDDELLFREGLGRILTEFGNFEVVGSAENGRELLNLLESGISYDIIMLDLSMPVMDGIETLKVLISDYADVRVAILSSHYDPSIIVNLIELGAASFFAKNEKPAELIIGLNNIVSMGFHYSPYIIKLLRDKMLYGTKFKNNLGSLTARETEVLHKLCEQKTAKEIGNELFISARTVEGHRNKLLIKTGSKNIAGLIIMAIENGIYKVEIDEFNQRFSQ